jgi:hypothetical protein
VNDDETPWWIRPPEPEASSDRQDDARRAPGVQPRVEADDPTPESPDSPDSPDSRDEAPTQVSGPATPPLTAPPAPPHLAPSAPPAPAFRPGPSGPSVRPAPVPSPAAPGPPAPPVVPPAAAPPAAAAPPVRLPSGWANGTAAAEPATVADDAPTEALPADLAPDGPPAPGPPRRARPAVRRVAVDRPVPPLAVPPPPAQPALDRTEMLPQVPDEIFATFSGPGGPDPVRTPEDRGGGLATRIRARQRTEADPDGRGLLPRALPRVEPQTAVFGGVGLVLVVVLIALITLVGLPGGDEDPEPTPTQQAQTAAAGTFDGGRPSGLAKVPGDQATSMLAQVQEGNGTVVEAWTWNDQNGKNLVATTREPRSGGHVTLRVIHVAQLEGEPKTLRVMEDPDLPRGCPGTAGFTPRSLQVSDLDGNGVAEVAAGWAFRCTGDDQTQVRLALISDGAKYIVRGQGTLQKSGSAEPEPAAKKWPDGFSGALGKLFRKLYYTP